MACGRLQARGRRHDTVEDLRVYVHERIVIVVAPLTILPETLRSALSEGEDHESGSLGTLYGYR